ncbi:MAG: universal stress protein [Desulfurivibrio sp.]
MKLLVPHDGSDHAYKTLNEAVKLAGKLGEAEITLLIVVPDLCLLDVGIDECKSINATLAKEAEGIKAKIRQKLADRNISGQVLIKPGAPEDCILATADEINADLIVIGASGKHGGGGRGPLGSVAHKVVSRSSRSVMVIR